MAVVPFAYLVVRQRIVVTRFTTLPPCVREGLWFLIVEILEIVTLFYHMWCVKRICVFEHSVMTNFNCACSAIQRGQRAEDSLDSLLVWASSGGSGETARMRRLAWTFADRIGDKYQIRLTWPNHDVASQSVIKPCIKNDTQLVD